MAAGSPCGPRGRKPENPFLSNERTHLPEMSGDMWECRSQDEPRSVLGGTPVRSEGSSEPRSLDSSARRAARSPGWTPASSGWSKISPCQRATEEAEAEAYFHDRERRGLVTPAQTPSDFMRRGPLYDPDDSGISPVPFRIPQSLGPSPSSVCEASPEMDGSDLGLPQGFFPSPTTKQLRELQSPENDGAIAGPKTAVAISTLRQKRAGADPPPLPCTPPPMSLWQASHTEPPALPASFQPLRPQGISPSCAACTQTSISISPGDTTHDALGARQGLHPHRGWASAGTENGPRSPANRKQPPRGWAAPGAENDPRSPVDQKRPSIRGLVSSPDWRIATHAEDLGMAAKTTAIPSVKAVTTSTNAGVPPTESLCYSSLSASASWESAQAQTLASSDFVSFQLSGSLDGDGKTQQAIESGTDPLTLSVSRESRLSAAGAQDTGDFHSVLEGLSPIVGSVSPGSSLMLDPSDSGSRPSGSRGFPGSGVNRVCDDIKDSTGPVRSTPVSSPPTKTTQADHSPAGYSIVRQLDFAGADAGGGGLAQRAAEQLGMATTAQPSGHQKREAGQPPPLPELPSRSPPRPPISPTSTSTPAESNVVFTTSPPKALRSKSASDPESSSTGSPASGSQPSKSPAAAIQTRRPDEAGFRKSPKKESVKACSPAQKTQEKSAGRLGDSTLHDLSSSSSSSPSALASALAYPASASRQRARSRTEVSKASTLHSISASVHPDSDDDISFGISRRPPRQHHQLAARDDPRKMCCHAVEPHSGARSAPPSPVATMGLQDGVLLQLRLCSCGKGLAIDGMPIPSGGMKCGEAAMAVNDSPVNDLPAPALRHSASMPGVTRSTIDTMSRENMSLEELQCALDTIRARYSRSFLIARPARYASGIGHCRTTSLGRTSEQCKRRLQDRLRLVRPLPF